MAAFIPSSTFTGKREGYKFSAGSSGVGYYLEGKDATADAPGPARKRAREGEHNAVGKAKTAAGAVAAGGNNTGDRDVGVTFVDVDELTMEDLDEESLARMLEEADNIEVPEATAAGVRQLLVALEKRIKKNQQMRVKFPDQPEKFLDSEIELDKAISDLQALATSPELYPEVVSFGGPELLLGLLAHENTDVGIAAVSLLAELADPEIVLGDANADPDAAAEAAAAVAALVDAIADKQGLELLVQNLGRLDESNEEDAKGVQLTVQLLQNMVEVNPALGEALAERTSLLRFLLKRVRGKKFDYNKLVCSEVLAQLLNSSAAVRAKLHHVQGTDGIDALLNAVAVYKRRDPTSEDEAMCIENLFDALSAALLLLDNQDRFRKNEGIELMVRCLREKKFAAWPAIRVLDFACTNNKANCHRLVQAQGLGALCPMLMGRGAARPPKKPAAAPPPAPGSKKSTGGGSGGGEGDKAAAVEPWHARGRRKRGGGEWQAMQQQCASVVASLALFLTDEGDCRTRFVAKFLESGAGPEKVERVLELFDEYSECVERFDESTAAAVAAAAEAEDMDTAEDGDDDAEDRELQRLEAGGYTQRAAAATVLAVAARSGAAAERIVDKLRQHGRSLAQVCKVVLEYIDSLGEAPEEGKSELRERLIELLPQPEVEPEAELADAAEPGESAAVGGAAAAAGGAGASAVSRPLEANKAAAATVKAKGVRAGGRGKGKISNGGTTAADADDELAAEYDELQRA